MNRLVWVSGRFDDLRLKEMLFLQAAAKLGPLQVLLWSDARTEAICGAPVKFPLAERRYFMESIRYVERVTVLEDPLACDRLPPSIVAGGGIWAVQVESDHPEKRAFCAATGMEYQLIDAALHSSSAPQAPMPSGAGGGRKKVIVTGCYDWLHSGHVRFFEEAAQFGDLYVVIGSDRNVRLLKGEGHPLFPQAQRLFMVSSIRFVSGALVSSGSGWMDAEPEIAQLKPDVYVVNEDGDVAEKRDFCQVHGLEYCVLKRLPKEGLPRRQSTNLRGF